MGYLILSEATLPLLQWRVTIQHPADRVAAKQARGRAPARLTRARCDSPPSRSGSKNRMRQGDVIKAFGKATS